MRDMQPRFPGSGSKHRMESARPGTNSRLAHGPGWPQAKSLTMIPELYRVALAYGINPLTGSPSPAGSWRCRNVVRWCRPNPPVGALGDKVRPATSDMVIACTARDRYFDLDAVRTPRSPNTHNRLAKGVDSRPNMTKNAPGDYRPDGFGSWTTIKADDPDSTAPPLDHWWADPDTFDNDAWLVSTEPYGGSHFATWPRKLLTRPILSMCPSRVCRECGQPSRRIVDVTPTHDGEPIGAAPVRALSRINSGGGIYDGGNPAFGSIRETTGWSDCGHDNWRPGITLDPFAGSGTTLSVATGHGRDALGFDFDARNADLALERVGPMFLTVQTLDEWKVTA